jgi:hypothetical protein
LNCYWLLDFSKTRERLSRIMADNPSSFIFKVN